ncbi:hypothetical protein Dsin_017293 [Dipteronia sinensis]|uniref:Uncharacterized protein n=1 Tax=Dipteronia sinensis TaxID=43782 RepID=A0AAE0E6J9_9ROSI|nr:hypothetical protein Dsin_017293 [Dipteronia sinensis]
MNLEPFPLDEVISAVNYEIEPYLCSTNLPIKIRVDDSPTTTSPDHSLWLSRIKNIDRVPIIGLSSPSKSSSNKKKKKKKRTAKKGKGNSSQAKELDDLRFSGFPHTWYNKRSNGCISKKLDRVLVNNERLVKFEHSEASFLPPSILDHCPFMVKLGLPAEEDLFRQKSRIQWLKAGDHNSSYIFKAINGRSNRSKIQAITSDDGSLIEGDIPVKNEAIHLF